MLLLPENVVMELMSRNRSVIDGVVASVLLIWNVYGFGQAT